MIHRTIVEFISYSVFGLTLALVAGSQQGVLAQAPAAPPAAAQADTLEAIEEAYQNELTAVERRRLDRIAALAEKKTGEESHDLWRLYFDTVISEEIFGEAEKTAEKVLLMKELPVDIRGIAEATHLIAEAKRGALEESIANVKKLFEAAREAKDDDLIIPAHVQLGLVEVYLRTIVDAGRYDLARKAIDTMTAAAKSDELIEYLVGEKAGLERIGKPVAEVKGTDVDGRPFDLAALKGKPVLVLFWATWDEISEELLESVIGLAAAQKDHGLEVVTINVDRLREDAEPPADLAVDVRRFLVERNLLWKSLISETGEKDYAKALGVRYLPSNLVIDREGIVRHVDRSPAGLAAAVEEVCKPAK